MRRELYLFAAALLFVSGNLTAGYICEHTAGPDSQATAATIFLYAYRRGNRHGGGRRYPSVRLLLFLPLGAAGIAANIFFRPGPEISVLHESRSTAFAGIITGGGISSTGRPFMEVELEQEKTIIYNIPEDIRWMPGDTLNATGLRCQQE